MDYIYAVTLTGWGLTKYKSGGEVGFVKSKKAFRNDKDATQDARQHARKAIETAKRFGRVVPRIHGVAI